MAATRKPKVRPVPLAPPTAVVLDDWRSSTTTPVQNSPQPAPLHAAETPGTSTLEKSGKPREKDQKQAHPDPEKKNSCYTFDPPLTVPDGLQFIWRLGHVHEKTFKQKQPSAALSDFVTSYFPNARAYFVKSHIFAGSKENNQVRAATNGHILVEKSLGISHKTDTDRKRNKNIFTDSTLERLIQCCLAGNSPTELALDGLRAGLQLLVEDLREKGADLLDCLPSEFYQKSARLLRVEFCRDYSSASLERQNQMEKDFHRAAVQFDGNLYTERKWKDGGILHLCVQPRHTKRKFGRKEKTFIKGYQKNDLFRVEMTYHYPKSTQDILTAETLCDELREIKKDADLRLDFFHEQLGDV